MKRFRKILVAVDTRFDQQFLVDQAVKIAHESEGELLLVDVMPDLPAMARLVVKESEHLVELALEEKRTKLQALAEPLRVAGVKVATKVLRGRTSVAIIQEVHHYRADLVLRITKGKQSRATGFFGTTAWRLLRHCPCPVWLLRNDRPQTFGHLLACVNTSSEDPADAELNDKIVELAQSLSEHLGGRYSLVHAWSLWGEQFLEKRLPAGELETLRRKCRNAAAKPFHEFLDKRGIPRDAAHVHLMDGDPRDVIPEFVAEHEVDVLIMGTVARAGLVGLVMGNDVEKILGKVQCSVLALKPATFVSSISEGEG